MSINSGVRHECGLFGIYSNENKNLADIVYYGLFALQHRGQESAGIAVAHHNKISYHKDLGLVSEVFNKQLLHDLPEGDIALGHVRYATAATRNIVNAQPIVFSGSFKRMAICHNGNLVNGSKLRQELIDDGNLFQSITDCETMAALINKYTEDDIIDGVVKACNRLEGGFAFVLNTTNQLIGIRDRNGITPLILGKLIDDYILSSESCAIEAIGGTVIRDVEPGEIIVIDAKGIKSYKMNKIEKRACIFEMLYIARSDSRIDGRSVYDARFDAGRYLAIHYNIDADVVSGAPDSGIVSGRGYSAESGIPYLDILCKNRYIGRSFIQPEQVIREKSVKIKLNAVKTNVEGKRVILVDDSIVRGTTCKKTVEMLRGAGALEVHLMVASPPVMHPCFYGVDMTSYNQLIAANHSIDEICKIVGADSINYIPLEKLIESCGANGDKGFCTACFTGDYPIKIEEEEVK